MKPKGFGIIIEVGKPKIEDKNMNENQDMNDMGEDGDMKDKTGMDMQNVVCLPSGKYDQAQDGDNVQGSFEGTVVDHGDGNKYVVVKTIDGSPVKNMDEENSPDDENGQTNENDGDVSSAKQSLMDSIDNNYPKRM